MSLERFREARFSTLLKQARVHLEKNDGKLSGSFSVPGTCEEHRRLNGFLGTERRATGSGLKVDVARLDATLRTGIKSGWSNFWRRLGPRCAIAARFERTNADCGNRYSPRRVRARSTRPPGIGNG